MKKRISNPFLLFCLINVIFLSIFVYLFAAGRPLQVFFQFGGLFFFLFSIILLFFASNIFISPLILTFIAYLVYFGIGLSILSFTEANYYPLFLFSLFIFCLSAGASFVKIMVTSLDLKKVIKNLKNKKLEGFLPSTVSLLILFSFSLVFYILVFMKMGGIPLLNPFLRKTKGVTFLKDFANVLGFVSILGIYLKSHFLNRSFLKKIFLVLFSIFGGINMFLLLSRHVIFELTLMLSILYYILSGFKKKDYFLLGLAGVVIIAGGQIFRTFIYENSFSLYHLTKLFPTLYKRLILIGGKTLFYIYNNFLTEYPLFLGGTYIKRLINLYEPLTIPDIGYWLFEKVTGSFGGYNPISMIGEFYINFGIIGSILGMFLLGITIQLFTIHLLKKKTLYGLTIFGIGSVLFIRTFAYSLMGFIFYFLLVIFVLLLLKTLDQTVQSKKILSL